MIRVLLYLAVAVIIVYVATTVPLGKHTLVGHIRAIWHTEQVQDLKDGIKQKTGPAVEKLERGAKAGLHEVTGSDSASTTTDTTGTPAPAH
jgi:hypothetical protein